MQDRREERNKNAGGDYQSLNSTIKNIKSLLYKKYREVHGQYIVEGEKTVLEALVSDSTLDMIVFSETYNHYPVLQAVNPGIQCFRVKEQIFKQLSDTQSPQGVLAVVRQKKYDLQQAVGQNICFLVILDAIKDPGNLGTIIRT